MDFSTMVVIGMLLAFILFIMNSGQRDAQDKANRIAAARGEALGYHGTWVLCSTYKGPSQGIVGIFHSPGKGCQHIYFRATHKNFSTLKDIRNQEKQFKIVSEDTPVYKTTEDSDYKPCDFLSISRCD